VFVHDVFLNLESIRHEPIVSERGFADAGDVDMRTGTHDHSSL